MNGCLIIGTWDGANIEIAEETGVDNVFVFGVRAEEINQLRKDRATFKTDTRSVWGSRGRGYDVEFSWVSSGRPGVYEVQLSPAQPYSHSIKGSR